MLEAIAAWPLVTAVRDSAIAYPMVSAAHIACIGLLLGAIVALDLRLLGAFRSSPVAHLAPPLERVAMAGFGGATLTGALLFGTRPDAYLSNPAFLVKLGLIGVGLLNVIILRRGRRWIGVRGGGPVPASVRAAALVSLLVWPAVIVCGRWIGFLQ